MVALDLWGIAFKKDDLGAASIILRGNEAVEYIKNQFLEAEPNLSTTVGAGRITKAGVWGLLARLHLNAGVYRDPYASSIVFNTPGANSVIFNSKILVGDYEIAGNSISTVVSNSSIDIRPNGAGTIELEANTNITGNLNVSGNINAVGNVTIGGNIIIGDSLVDNLVIIHLQTHFKNY
jgi:hypothetical protein